MFRLGILVLAGLQKVNRNKKEKKQTSVYGTFKVAGEPLTCLPESPLYPVVNYGHPPSGQLWRDWCFAEV